MDRIFAPRDFITVPDGTQVSAFLNATDESQEDVPWHVLGESSIAAGRIEPGVSSSIVVHPALAQVTYGISGTLRIWMRDAKGGEPYCLALEPGRAVVSEPGTLLQLVNDGDAAAEVLYIVSPSYVFEKSGDEILHDDAIPVARTWDELKSRGDEGPALQVTAYEARALRAEALRRIAARRGHGPAPLEAEAVRSLPEAYDYLAPDGSEIRLLAEGDNAGFAHCALPPGAVSAPVRHRTVEELWYVLGGSGEIWRGRDGDERVDALRPGDSIRIPVGTAFQFRAGSEAGLSLLLATSPPWPGAQEAVPAPGRWTPGVAGRGAD